MPPRPLLAANILLSLGAAAIGAANRPSVTLMSGSGGATKERQSFRLMGCPVPSIRQQCCGVLQAASYQARLFLRLFLLLPKWVILQEMLRGKSCLQIQNQRQTAHPDSEICWSSPGG